MTPRSIKLIVGALLVAAPAGLGVGAVSDDVTVPVLESSQTAAPENGEVVETFEKEFDDPPTTGALDLRIDHGTVKVVGWEESAYKIEVVQTETDGSGQTEVDFQDNTNGDHLNLSVTVDRNEDTGARVSVGPVDQGEARPDKAIVAHVPASASYESVYACEGEHSSTYNTVDETLDRIPGVEDSDEHEVCVPTDDEAANGGHVIVGQHNSSQLGITGGVADLQGQTLDVETDDHNLAFDAIEFGEAEILTDDGDVTASNVTTGALDLKSDNGDVDAEGDLGELKVVTDDGDLALTGTAGVSEVDTDNGEVTLDGTVGDLTLGTDDGDVTLSGEAGATELDSDNGDLDVHGVAFASLDVSTDDGDVQGDEVTTDGLDVRTDNGRVDLGGQLGDVDARTDDGDVLLSGDVDEGVFDSDNGKIHVIGTMDTGEIATDDGDVVLELTPETDGEIDVDSDNGAVTVAVPEDDPYGYDVLAGTDNGDIEIGLNETEDQDDDPLSDESAIENSEHERTRGFEDRDIQVHLTATTDDGDIRVVNHEADLDTDDGDEGEEGNSGLLSQATSAQSAADAAPR